MKKATLIILCLGLFALNGAAQKLTFSDVYIIGGVGASTSGTIDDQAKERLQSGFTLPTVTNNYSNYYYNESYRNHSQLGMMAAWKIRSKANVEQRLRLGFMAGSYQVNWNNYYSESENYRVDTLVSAQTGRTFYVDSMHNKNLFYWHEANMLTVNIDYLRTLNPQNKLSLYVGAGTSLGVSLNNTITANYTEHSNLTSYQPYSSYGPGSNYGYDNYKFETQSKSLSAALNYNLYSLFGVNYQLSKKSAFLKHMSLFAEWRMGLEVSRMDIINSNAGFLYGFQGGLRVSL